MKTKDWLTPAPYEPELLVLALVRALRETACRQLDTPNDMASVLADILLKDHNLEKLK